MGNGGRRLRHQGKLHANLQCGACSRESLICNSLADARGRVAGSGNLGWSREDSSRSTLSSATSLAQCPHRPRGCAEATRLQRPYPLRSPRPPLTVPEAPLPLFPNNFQQPGGCNCDPRVPAHAHPSRTSDPRLPLAPCQSARRPSRAVAHDHRAAEGESAAPGWEEDPGTGQGAVRGGASGGASGSGAQSWGVSAPPRSAPPRPRPVRCAPSLLAATPAVAAAAPADTASEVGAAERARAMPEYLGPWAALLGSLQGGDQGRIGRGRRA